MWHTDSFSVATKIQCRICSSLDCRRLGPALTDVSDISIPANSMEPAAKTNLSGLRVMPLLPHMSSHFTATKKASSMLADQSSGSSTHLVLLGISALILSYRRNSHPQRHGNLVVQQRCKCCKVSVILMQRYAMASIPRMKYCFLCVIGGRSSLKEGGLCVMSFGWRAC